MGNDEHPLLSELRALQATILQQQQDLKCLSNQLTDKEITTSRAVSRANTLSHVNDSLQSEIAVLRAASVRGESNLLALPSKEWSIALRRAADKYSYLESSLKESLIELHLANAKRSKAIFERDEMHALLIRMRDQRELDLRKIRELNAALDLASKEKAMMDLTMSDYADLVRSLTAPSSPSFSPSESGPSKTLSQGLSGLSRLFIEHSSETEELQTRISLLQSELDQMKVELLSEQEYQSHLQSFLTEYQVRVSDMEADDRAASKVVARYMKFSQESTNALQQTLAGLRSRHTATVQSLEEQLSLMQNDLTAEQAAHEKTQRLLSEERNRVLYEQVGRRREVSLRLKSIDQMTRVLEQLGRLAGKYNPAFQRLSANDGYDLYALMSSFMNDFERLRMNFSNLEGTHAKLLHNYVELLRVQYSILSQKSPKMSHDLHVMEPYTTGEPPAPSDLMQDMRPPKQASNAIYPGDLSDGIAENRSSFSPPFTNVQVAEAVVPYTAQAAAPSPFEPTTVADCFVDTEVSEKSAARTIANVTDDHGSTPVEVRSTSQRSPSIEKERPSIFGQIDNNIALQVPDLMAEPPLAYEDKHTNEVAGATPSMALKILIDPETIQSTSSNDPGMLSPLQQESLPASSQSLGSQHSMAVVSESKSSPFPDRERRHSSEFKQMEPPSLSEQLSLVTNRYDCLQKSLYACHQAIRKLKEDFHVLNPSVVGSSFNLTAAKQLNIVLDRLDDYNEDARVELEIGIADEGRAAQGFMALVTLSSGQTSGENALFSTDISTFLSEDHPPYQNLSGTIRHKLEDIKHDIGILQEQLYRLIENSADSETSIEIQTNDWASWANGVLSPSTSRPSSPGPTLSFGAVMSSRSNRQRLCSELGIVPTFDFSTLGLRIAGPTIIQSKFTPSNTFSGRLFTANRSSSLGLGISRNFSPFGQRPIISHESPQGNRSPPKRSESESAGSDLEDTNDVE